jgi:hypothetical protein
MKAILNGTLTDGGGLTCDCGFEWGNTPAYGNVTSTQKRTIAQTFSATLDALAPGTYHYRAFATNAAGTGYGQDLSFPITLGMPVVQTLPADQITESQANLNGYLSVDDGYPCSLWFEWGADANYGNKTIAQYFTAPSAFSQLISDLTNGAAYHFRAVAQNANGIGYGNDQVFETLSFATVGIGLGDLGLMLLED